MESLQLDFVGCWAISCPRWDAVRGFASLPTLCDDGAILYLEGGVHSSEFAKFLRANAIPPQQEIARGTIWPRQTTHHLPATQSVFAKLSNLADHHALPEICEHLVVYLASTVLVDWYDLFDREAYVSSSVPEQTIRRFADTHGATYRIESS